MAKQERKLPETLEHEFVITDESVNRYGWRLLVSGIDLSGFLMNPVCCTQHNTWDIPVGKWKNVRVEKEKLLGTVEFDRNDEDAVKLYWKYRDGFMNAVSLNIYPIEESDDPSRLLPGQKRATVTKSELLEISLVTLPGQKNAIKLTYPDGKEYKLGLSINNLEMEKETKTVEQLQAELQTQKKLNADNLIKLHRQRGVVSDGEVEPLKELALSNYESVSRMLEARTAPDPASGEGTKENPAEALAEALVKLHFDRGAISEQEKSVYKLSAIADYEGARKVLEAKTGTREIKTFVQGIRTGAGQGGEGSDERSKWTYLDYYKKDMRALGLMEKEDPEKYKKLVSDFEAECSTMGI